MNKDTLSVINDIHKKHGEGSIFKMGDKVDTQIPCIPSGLPVLDEDIIGIGGIPKGRITEIYGAESGGKTSLLLAIIASAQRLEKGKACAFIDAEHALDASWASRIGVNMDDLFVSQPDSGEEAIDIAERLSKSGQFSVIGIDSVAALVPQAELDGEISDANIGLQARLMSKTCRKLRHCVHETGTALIFINQLREKIGITFTQGPTHTTSGGRALRFYASLRLEVTRVGSFKEGEEIVGNTVKIKAVKNKLAPPFKEAELQLRFDRGFDNRESQVDSLIKKGIFKKSGAWIYYEHKDLKFQGKKAAREYVEANLVELTGILSQGEIHVGK